MSEQVRAATAHSPGRRRGLGRGLEALLASTAVTPETEVAGEDTLAQIDPRAVRPNPEQPRRHFSEEALETLAESIRQHGLLHPIVVERSAEGYQLIAGEMRLRASVRAGLPTIPAVVRPATDSARNALELALIENLVRAELSPLEEAAAYLRLADVFGLSHEAIASRVGKSRPAVTNAIRLLSLPASVQTALGEGRLSAGHARALLAFGSAAEQEQLAVEIQRHGLTVRQVEQAAQRRQRPATPSRPRPARPGEKANPRDEAVRSSVEKALGMPVQLTRNGTGGRLTIEFYNDADLNALVERLVELAEDSNPF